jgi:hypothetical protein
MKPYVIILSALVLFGCASPPKPDFFPAIQTSPIEILDLIAWEDNTLFEVNTIPINIIKVLYNYNYKYINYTQTILQDGDTGYAGPVSIFERRDASYDDSDDTFLFHGIFYPFESLADDSDENSETTVYRDIWMVFSQEENYGLFMDPNWIQTNKEGYTVQDNYSLIKRIVE